MNNLHGVNPQEVYNLLIERRSNGYCPNQHSDGKRLALAVEGGGMRGVVSSGAIDALFQLGFDKCFDVIYGNSAGAINGAYFLSGNITMGTSIYYESLTNRKFINFFRWPNIMNIHYLFDEWILKGKLINLDNIINSPTILYISVTDTNTGQPFYFDNRIDDPVILISALRASSSTPLFSTNKEIIDGKSYNDGIVSVGIPIIKAIKDKCTHVVCLLTREHGYRKKHSNLTKLFDDIILRKYSAAYKNAYHASKNDYNKCLDIIYHNHNNISTLVIAPNAYDLIVNNGDIDPNRLRKATRDSLDRVALLFGEDNTKLKMYS